MASEWQHRVYEIDKRLLADPLTLGKTLARHFDQFRHVVKPSSPTRGDNLVLMWGDDFHRLCRGFNAPPAKELVARAFAMTSAVQHCTRQSPCPICRKHIASVTKLLAENL